MSARGSSDVAVREAGILVAEGSPIEAERLRLLLEGAGFRVAVVADGREGVKRTQMASPDLIISDLVMPEMDGYAFCQAVKAHARTRHIPFVLLTERNTPLEIIEGLSRGADNFIPKPFEDGHFVERVRRIFEHLKFRGRNQWHGVEVILPAGNRWIPITADKQQILELLLATCEEVARVNVVLGARDRDLEAKTRELAEAYRQLEAVSGHESGFLSSVSHELRSPLRAIIGLAELLREQALGLAPYRQARYLDHIQQEATHLLQLINDILDFSMLGAGKLGVEPQPLSLAPIFEDILIIARGVAHQKTQTLQADIQPNLPRLHADPVGFKQICFNLVSNALKFTPKGGSITLFARKVDQSTGQRVNSSPPIDHVTTRQIDRPGEWLEITVRDTGIGIKAEDLPRLFQEFVQLEAAGTKGPEGTGLGLALTKKLVELHGGQMWAASEGKGRGSTFTVLLPFGEPQE